jgi:hypothetical protein
MTVSEALKKIVGTTDWARPVTWKGNGRGVIVEQGQLSEVPSSRGGRHFVPSFRDLTVRWEVVSVEDIYEGK